MNTSGCSGPPHRPITVAAQWKVTTAAVGLGVPAKADTGGWTRVAAPESGLECALEDVSAAGPDLARAVGREGSGLTERPVAHRWNGSALERQRVDRADDAARRGRDRDQRGGRRRARRPVGGR
jgi:hypothetical protein